MTVPRLSTYRPGGAELLITDSFTGWAGNGWVEQDTGGDLSGAWGANGAFAVSALASSPPILGTELVKTFTGLPINTLIAVRIGLSWSLGVGAPGGPGTPVAGLFFGATAGGVRGALPGPVFFDPDIREILILATSEPDGSLEVRVGATGLVGSYDIAAGFATVSASTLAGELADIFYDAGVMYIAGSQVSITRGGIVFDSQEVWDSYDFPGKSSPVQGCDEIVSSTPVLRTRFMLTGEYQFTIYRPGGAWTDGVVADSRTYTLGALRTALATGFYLTDVIAVWPRARGDYVAVHFPVAICRKYGMSSTDKDEGGLDVEIEARVPADAASFAAVPYLLHTYAADTETPG